VPAVAFLFTQRPPSGFLSDEEICARIVRGLIAKSTRGSPSRASIRSGGLLLHRYAYRAVEFSEAQEFRGRASFATGEKVKLETWAYLLADFAEAIRETWHLGKPAAIDAALEREGVEVYSVSSLELEAARRLHESVGDVDGYLGAMQLDLGHPVIYQVCWAGLFRRYQVVNTELGFLDSCGDPIEERWPLDVTDDRWWHTVGASEIYWTRSSDESKPHPDQLLAQPDSRRGAAARNALGRLTAPTPMERLLKFIRPEHLPPDTKRFSAEPIPGAADAVIPEKKLREYALNLDHPDGGPKARAFLEILGIKADDWRYLALQLEHGVREAPAFRSVSRNDYGVRFDVITAVKGRNGVIKPVLSAWIALLGRPPSLTTTYLAPRNEEPHTRHITEVPLLPRDQHEDWQSLWEVASAAAAQAAHLVVPEPIHVSGPADPGQWYLSGVEGVASVRVFDARRGFARWLRQRGFGSAHHKSGTRVSAPGRSYDINVAWANTFAEVLQWHGVECEVIAYMT
jgi:hypothetical protein